MGRLYHVLRLTPGVNQRGWESRHKGNPQPVAWGGHGSGEDMGQGEERGHALNNKDTFKKEKLDHSN